MVYKFHFRNNPTNSLGSRGDENTIVQINERTAESGSTIANSELTVLTHGTEEKNVSSRSIFGTWTCLMWLCKSLHFRKINAAYYPFHY